ncbi:MAG: DUF4838 domain-containing protein [Phycisphaeraceae bacterium]|nr:DUF4838 domain-containing protein [Phycisphaeraceae bacterium]
MIHLSQQGATAYTIIIGQDAPEPEKYAGQRLADYLHRITGATYPIVTDDQAPAGQRIIVGQNRLSQAVLNAKELESLGTDGLIVRTHGADLLLVGGRPRGTIYAVNSFLEQDLGCRWLSMYGEKHVPASPTLELGRLDRRETPAFRNRDIYILYTLQNNQDRQNYFLGNRVNGAWDSVHFLNDSVGGSDWAYTGPGCHSLFHYMNPSLEHSHESNKITGERLLKEHPEYLSLIDGKRVATHQLCFSNAEMRSEMTNNIMKVIGEHGGTGFYSISAMDVPKEFCECPRCQAMVQRDGTPGAPLFDYLVELCNVVKEKYPKAWISTLGYRQSQTQTPPKGRALPDNFAVVFAPIDKNFAASFMHPSNAQTLADLKAWCAVCKHVWVWYYVNPYSGNGWLPIGNQANLVTDFRLFKQLGVEGFFVQNDVGVTDSHLLADMQTWIITKMMWNPDQDMNALIHDFTDHFYGPAAADIRQYIGALEQATHAMTTTMSWSPDPSQYRFLTPAFLAQMQTVFDHAESTVAGDPILLRRVRQARMSLDCATLTCWNQQDSDRVAGATRQDIAKRYTDIYTQTLRLRKNPGVFDSNLQTLHIFLEPRLNMTPPKPLPASLSDIPQDRIRQILPDMGGFCLDAKLATDPQAAASICIGRPTEGELPLTLGFDDETRKAFVINGQIEKKDILPGKYQLHKIGRAALNERCNVWISKSWTIGFTLNSYYDALHSDQAWDIYVSLRFDGPAYGGEDPAAVNHVSVDRLILVKVP